MDATSSQPGVASRPITVHSDEQLDPYAPRVATRLPLGRRKLGAMLLAVILVALAMAASALVLGRGSSSETAAPSSGDTRVPMIEDEPSSTEAPDPSDDEVDVQEDDLDTPSAGLEGYTEVLSTALSTEERADVRRVQRCLNRQGYGAVAVDGHYGPTTAASVRAFQRDYGLQVDGVVGPETWKPLCGGWLY